MTRDRCCDCSETDGVTVQSETDVVTFRDRWCDCSETDLVAV